MAGSTKIFSSFTTTFVSRVQLNIPTGRLGWATNIATTGLNIVFWL